MTIPPSTVRQRRRAPGAVLDPRGRPPRPVRPLAPRRGLAALQRGPLLLFDNTKLSAGHYPEVFPRLRERLAMHGVTRVIERRRTVRGTSVPALRALAAALAETGAVAAVLALADMGVSPATTVLAIALEERGIPAVVLTASPAHTLAETVAFYQAGALCLCRLDLHPASSVAEVRAAVDAQAEAILESLASPEAIDERARLHCPLDRDPPAADGLLALGDAVDPDAGAAAADHTADVFDRLRIGDGLPVVPPTPERYARMLAFCPWPPESLLVAEAGPAGAPLTVRDAAVAAVMAGCRPEAMPVLVTALRAVARPAYNLLQGLITSHNGGNLLLVSGPIAQEVGLHGGSGCLGPGFRANATVGRALNLVLVNVGRAVPGVSDLACLASPAELTYCFAEDPALSPWPTINAERFDAATTTVFALKAEPPHSVMDFGSQTADGLLETLAACASSLGSNNAYVPGHLVVVLNPDHAALLARDGHDKGSVRQALHEMAGNDAAALAGRGLVAVTPGPADARGRVRVTRGPGDVEVVVAGGRGGHSAVIRPWALHSDAVVEPMLRPDGRVARSLGDFRRTPA